MTCIDIPILPLCEDVQLPQYAHAGDAGLDLQANEEAVLAPFERKVIGCGFAIGLPEGYAAFVLPRSGLSSKAGITVVNAPGLIDSGYRGEIKVALVNLNAKESYAISKGDRIAQMVIMPVPPVQLNPVSELDSTERGAGGFGSTGFSSRKA